MRFCKSSGDLCVVEEDESGYVIANVKPKPEDDNGYVQANVHDHPNVVDESGYAMMVIIHDKMAKDKDGYLISIASQKKGIYVNDTNFCAVGDPNVERAESSLSNGKDITLIRIFIMKTKYRNEID